MTEILSQRADKPKTTNQLSKPMLLNIVKKSMKGPVKIFYGQ